MSRTVAGRLRLALPSVGAGSLRLIQLVVLAALGHLASADTQDVLVTSFGVLSAFAIVSDSGAGNYLLALPRKALSKAVYRHALRVQLVTVALGALLAFSVIIAIANGRLGSNGLLIIAALSLAQMIDGTGKAVKAPLLINGRDSAYGAADAVAVLLKLPVLLTAFALESLLPLVALPMASAIQTAWLFNRVDRAIPKGQNLVAKGTSMQVLEVGVSGSLSALYSQTPVVIASFLLPISDAASYAAMTRLIQALEFVPATMLAQTIPRVRRAASLRRYWLLFATLGLALAIVAICMRPVAEAILGITISPGAAFLLLGFAFVAKSGNYLLVAILLSWDLARTRISINLGVGLFAISLCSLFALWFGIVGLAGSALAVEIVFAITATTLLSKRRVRSNQNGASADRPSADDGSQSGEGKRRFMGS